MVDARAWLAALTCLLAVIVLCHGLHIGGFAIDYHQHPDVVDPTLVFIGSGMIGVSALVMWCRPAVAAITLVAGGVSVMAASDAEHQHLVFDSVVSLVIALIALLASAYPPRRSARGVAADEARPAPATESAPPAPRAIRRGRPRRHPIPRRTRPRRRPDRVRSPGESGENG